MLTLKIFPDEMPESPREWDNVGTMACWHNRYKLGDVQPDVDAPHYIAPIRNTDLILPLYLYDHGGLTISTTPFNCPWDSGPVGYIHAPHDDSVDLETFLINEVAVYDQYLRGEVYGFVLEEDGEEIDSCWGFYGYDWRNNGIAEHVDANALHKVQYMTTVQRTVYDIADEETINEFCSGEPA